METNSHSLKLYLIFPFTFPITRLMHFITEITEKMEK